MYYGMQRKKEQAKTFRHKMNSVALVWMLVHVQSMEPLEVYVIYNITLCIYVWNAKKRLRCLD